MKEFRGLLIKMTKKHKLEIKSKLEIGDYLKVAQTPAMVFFIPPEFYKNKDLVKMIMFTKFLGKPMMVILHKGVKLPEIFNECNVEKIYYNKYELEDTREEKEKEILETVREMKQFYESHKIIWDGVKEVKEDIESMIILNS